MSLSTYNIIWKFLEKILPRYLEHRKKSGKEDIHRIHERYGNSKKIGRRGGAHSRGRGRGGVA